ncbi:hypothetical protein ACLAFG_003854 [Escherichia coli]|nr:hypothetical protein [Escherichia coli]EFG2981136.1 hypothetical protein [Escherichia coli]EFG6327280.1 hypothetical protein [Escherichia coli]EFG9812145.1 hypothetical protein [Escherichia coli]EFS9508377.1 hypothetical protein [Escherichia coli]
MRQHLYEAYPTASKFHAAWKEKKIRAMCGPFGSGKSVTCVNDLLYIAIRQKPAPDGVRYTRFGVIRATYPNLRTTTKKTLEQWLIHEAGGIKETAPMEGHYRFRLQHDGTLVDMELILLAVSDDESIKKLRSTDFTAIWINEATEVPASVFTTATERIGRYPSGERGACSWRGVIMDYNMPPRGHWLLNLFASERDDYALFMQPPAAFKHESDDGMISYEVNPEAENLVPLGGNDGFEGGIRYYQSQIDSKMLVGDYDGIDQLLCLKVVDDRSGKPVWPRFSRAIHVAKHVILPQPGLETMISIDTSGIHPAALFWQFIGVKWVILDELYGEETGFEDFVYGGLLPLVQSRYKESSGILAICDPANARNALTATTPVATLNEAHIRAQVAGTNNTKSRIEAVNRLLNKDVGGLLISPNCERVIASCAGGYKFGKMQIRGTVDVAYTANPVKNEHSHPADALQYGALYALRYDESSGDVSAVKRAFRDRLRKRRRIM